MEKYYEYILIAVIGVAVSFINSIAGGGSMLSLPAMIFMGIPATVANGTNRVGIFWGNISSVMKLYRSGKLEWRALKLLVLPVALGAAVGALFAVSIPDDVFKPILAGFILFVTFMTVFSSQKKIYNTEIDSEKKEVHFLKLIFWFF